jgi:hypothetical protein
MMYSADLGYCISNDNGTFLFYVKESDTYSDTMCHVLAFEKIITISLNICNVNHANDIRCTLLNTFFGQILSRF